MRVQAIQILLFFSFLAVLARLWYWQVLNSDNLTAKAEEQRITSRTLIAPRGSVYFSDGALLASTQPSYLVFAQPKIVVNKEQVAKTLAQIFWESEDHAGENLEEKDRVAKIKDIEEDILGKLNKDLFWISLGRKVDLKTKQKIEKEKFFGVGFDSSLIRFYPEGSSSAHLLGFVSSDAYGAETGYFGLEGFYNGELKGKNGQVTQDKDAQGLPILIGTYKIKEAKPGKSLVLNIDRTIQHIVEEKLKIVQEKYGPKSASPIES